MVEKLASFLAADLQNVKIDTLGTSGKGLALPLSAFAETSNALVALYDGDDRLRYANKAFREAYSVEAGEMPTWREIMYRNFFAKRGTIIDSTDIEGWLASAASRRGKDANRNIETNLHDGRWLWLNETRMANEWRILVGMNVTDLHTEGRSLRAKRDAALAASRTDELTGVSNRRHIMALAEEVVASKGHAASDRPWACLLDIDHFKSINDTYGHPAGDAVLVAFSRLIQPIVRVCDGFGRVGGEEFLIVMTSISSTELHEMLARIFHAVRKLRPLAEFPNLHLTISAGLAVAEPGDLARDLYGRCDGALYAAKTGGRGRLMTSQRHGFLEDRFDKSGH